jgi:class 3 adenylate cyclase/tetratricopeptide (TPR) repeat protein
MQQIADWLEKLGMSEYAQRFSENGIGFAALRHLTDQDLKDIGVLLGHRRIMLAAIRERGSPALAQPVTAELKPQNTAERRQVTVMFSDLVGSTALSARMDPEDLREIISAYQRCATETVQRFGGFVARFMGDGVLVYFGYPQAHEDDAERAVRAGLEMVAAVSDLKTHAPLQTRVGIATGLVVVGDLVGSGASQEQAIVGETPNLAARLQGTAEPNSVVIAESTRRLVGGLFEFEDLGPRDLKGISGPVRAWSALRPASVAGRFEAMHGSGLTDLVGREEELDLLLRRWSKAKSGNGQVVLLSGEAGIGKSRLTAALLERLATEPHTRLRYFCSPQHTDSALYPIISQMERAAGFAHDDTAPAKLDKLGAVLAQGSTPYQDAALFAEMLSLPNDGRYPTVEMAPQQRRQKTLQALTAQLEALSCQKPALMIFEDAHWTDPTSLEAFGRVVDRLKTLGVLLIVTHRPEFEPPWIGRPYVTALTLNRLGEGQSSAIIDSLAGNKLLSPSIRQDIIERTDGIPLFVEEMTKAVLEAESEAHARETAAAVPSSAIAVPASLHASLMARLDRLGSAKEIAQIGAAIGREFSHGLLAAIAGKPEIEIQSALDRLVTAGLLFRQGLAPHSTYLFKHALVQDAAYGTMLRGQRQQLHARIARTIEHKFPETMTAQPELLARHYALGGSSEPAINFWTIAGDFAERRAMSHEAIAHYKAARELLSSLAPSAKSSSNAPRLLMKLGNALQQAEGYNSATALEAYEEARAAARKLERIEDNANASIGMAPMLFGGCRYRQVLEIGEELSAHYLDRLGPHTRVHLLIMRGIANFGVGEHATAWEQTTTARVLDDKNPAALENPFGGADPAVVARVYATLPGLPLGIVDDSLSLVQEAVAIARNRNHSFSLAWALLSASRLYNVAGRFGEALSLGKEANALCERYGFVARMGTVLMQTGAAYCGLGETQRGLADIRHGLDLWRRTSGSFHMSYYLSDFAERLLRSREYDEADRALREAEQIVADTDERSHEGELFRLRGILLARSGHRPEAATLLRQAVQWARLRNAKLFELRALRDLTRLDSSWEEKNEVTKALADVIGWFPERLDIPDLREARDVLHGLSQF